MTEAVADASQFSLEQLVDMCIALSKIICIFKEIIPYPYQRKLINKIIEAVLRGEGDELLVLQARQSGKTEAITIAVITIAVFFVSVLKRKFKCGIFAPAKSQALEATRTRMQEWMTDLEDFVRSMGLLIMLGDGKTTNLYIFKDLETGNEARITSFSADKKANIKGPDLQLIILEQVEDMNAEKMKNDIFPMGSAVGGVRVLAGTSTTEIHNEYYYDRLRANPEDAIIIDSNEAGKYNPKYKLTVELDRERLGEESLEFRAQYLLEWGTSTIHFVEDRDAFLKLTRDISDIQGIKKTGGWDPARMSDYSVLSIMEASYEGEVERSYLTRWWYSQGTNLEEQVDTIVQICIEEEVELLVVDAIGIGIGVCDMLDKRLPRSTELVRLTMNAQQQDEMFKLFDREIKTGRFHYIKNPITKMGKRARNLFIQQMIRVEKRFSGKYLLVEAPKGKNHYDDFCDSAALALWGLKKEEKFVGGVGTIRW